MRNKGILLLIELSVILLVVAAAAGLCLQVFAWAEQTSLEEGHRAQALLCAQNAAQVLQSYGGDLQQAGGTWNGVCWILEQGEVTVYVTPRASGTPLLGEATVEAVREGKTLASLTVCWQEVTVHG